MGNLDNFNASEHEAFQDFSPLPQGVYRMAVEASELKATRAGNGTLLCITWTVLEGQYHNRKVWQNINIDNQSAAATQIGKRQLADLVRACGLERINDSSELHGIPVDVKLRISKVKEGTEFEPQNEVKGYLPRVPPGAAPLGAPAPKAAPAAPATPPKKPWGK